MAGIRAQTAGRWPSRPVSPVAAWSTILGRVNEFAPITPAQTPGNTERWEETPASARLISFPFGMSSHDLVVSPHDVADVAPRALTQAARPSFEGSGLQAEMNESISRGFLSLIVHRRKRGRG